VDAAVEQRLDASDEALRSGGFSDAPTSSAAVTWTEQRLKQRDTLTCPTGSSLLPLAGSVQVSYASGAVVDASTGMTVPSGAALSTGHRYMVAEDTTAVFSITSKTAVVDYQGGCSFNLSNAVDYNAMAAGLKQLHLFQGSFTGYGQGFDLEAAPTRLQALIMFIRVLGEEEQALAWSGSTPFQDIAQGSQAEKYVGYAYSCGYTNGYSATQFKPAGAVNAYQYTEFVLRALGYSSAGNTNLADTLVRAQNAGVLTAGEADMLQRDRFLRAELVYISYYALEAIPPGGTETLADVLASKGVFTRAEYAAARISGWRL